MQAKELSDLFDELLDRVIENGEDILLEEYLKRYSPMKTLSEQSYAELRKSREYANTTYPKKRVTRTGKQLWYTVLSYTTRTGKMGYLLRILGKGNKLVNANVYIGNRKLNFLT